MTVNQGIHDAVMAWKAHPEDDGLAEAFLEAARSVVCSVAKGYYVKGMDRDDMTQELCMHLLHCARGFDPGKGQASSWVALICHRHCYTLYGQAHCLKNTVWNRSVSMRLHSDAGDDEVDVHEFADPASEAKPDDSHEEQWRWLNGLDLSDMERELVRCFTHEEGGSSYEATARKMRRKIKWAHMDAKAVDNCLARLRQKVRKRAEGDPKAECWLQDKRAYVRNRASIVDRQDCIDVVE